MDEFLEDSRKKIDGSTNHDDTSFLKGRVIRITFRSSETGFGVIKIEPFSDYQQEDGSNVTVVGSIPESCMPGMSVTIQGRWKTHEKYGQQLQATFINEERPTQREDVIKYLSSGFVKGFGPAMAEKVVDTLGADALDVIDRNPQRLLDVPGIGAKKLQDILQSWKRQSDQREIYVFLQKHGISATFSQKIYKRFGAKTIDVLKENPYILAKEISGIGFKSADSIALSLEISPTSSLRLMAGLNHVLLEASESGHCFLPRDSLVEKSLQTLGVNDKEVLLNALEQAVREAEIVESNDNYYIPALYDAESSLAKLICKRIKKSSAPVSKIPPSLVNQLCETPFSGTGNRVIRFSDKQKQSVSLAAQERLLAITGGPGCGKTTVLRAIASLFKQAGLITKLAAPTGRAAQRLSEVCDMEASTIHRLLKFDPATRDFVHNSKEPLELDALIVDESSMIDIPLAASLFDALPNHAHVVIVGDADQLPSVGPGMFLSEILSIKEIPSVRLDTLFRREEESLITQVAHEINMGNVPKIPEPDRVTKTDAYFLQASEPEDVAQLVEKLVSDQIPRKFNIASSNITVLSAMNRGELGVKSLNKRLQAKLVPERSELPSVQYGNIEFRLGDRVCQRVNNYNIIETGVFNGDQGEIIGIDGASKSIVVQLWDGREVTYPSESIHELDLAYALTIHRSQGSEVPAVIMILHDSQHIMLERQLFYTGVTRAKSLLIVVGTKRAVILATKRMRSKKRHTALTERILEFHGEQN